MNVISVCVLGVFAVICAAALRKTSPETASMLLVSAVVFIALLSLPYIERVMAQLSGLNETALIKESYLQSMIKSVGICFITQITADVCRENGGQSAATQVELYGKLAILLIACPLYADLLSLVSKLLT